MASETVEDIKYRIYQHWRGCENCSLEEMDGADLIAIADQFEAAHKREVADLEWQLKIAREFTTWCGLGINKVGAKVMNKAIECEFMMNHREIYNKGEGEIK